MLTFLCVAQERALTQDAICESLWHGMGYASAVNRLHQTIYALRQCLTNVTGETDWITVKNKTVVMNKEISVDAMELFDAVKSSTVPKDLAELLTLQTQVSEDFAPWLPHSTYASEIAEKVRHAKIALTRQLLARMISQGNLEGARSQLDRLVTLSPYEEDLCRRAITLDIRLGRYQNAVDLFERYSRQLAQELGIRPSGELIELANGAKLLTRLWEQVSNTHRLVN